MKYLSGVTTLRLFDDKCTGCGMCVEVCPRGVFQIENRKSRIIDRDACMECGACERNCAFGALKVNSGVGCATAVINGFFRGTGPDCGCGGDDANDLCC